MVRLSTTGGHESVRSRRRGSGREVLIKEERTLGPSVYSTSASPESVCCSAFGVTSVGGQRASTRTPVPSACRPHSILPKGHVIKFSSQSKNAATSYPLGRLKSKRQAVSGAGEDAGELEPTCTLAGVQSRCEAQLGSSPKG